MKRTAGTAENNGSNTAIGDNPDSKRLCTEQRSRDIHNVKEVSQNKRIMLRDEYVLEGLKRLACYCCLESPVGEPAFLKSLGLWMSINKELKTYFTAVKAYYNFRYNCGGDFLGRITFISPFFYLIAQKSMPLDLVKDGLFREWFSLCECLFMHYEFYKNNDHDETLPYWGNFRLIEDIVYKDNDNCLNKDEMQFFLGSPTVETFESEESIKIIDRVINFKGKDYPDFFNPGQVISSLWLSHENLICSYVVKLLPIIKDFYTTSNSTQDRLILLISQYIEMANDEFNDDDYGIIQLVIDRLQNGQDFQLPSLRVQNAIFNILANFVEWYVFPEYDYSDEDQWSEISQLFRLQKILVEILNDDDLVNNLYFLPSLNSVVSCCTYRFKWELDASVFALYDSLRDEDRKTVIKHLDYLDSTRGSRTPDSIWDAEDEFDTHMTGLFKFFNSSESFNDIHERVIVCIANNLAWCQNDGGDEKMPKLLINRLKKMGIDQFSFEVNCAICHILDLCEWFSGPGEDFYKDDRGFFREIALVLVKLYGDSLKKTMPRPERYAEDSDIDYCTPSIYSIVSFIPREIDYNL